MIKIIKLLAHDNRSCKVLSSDFVELVDLLFDPGNVFTKPVVVAFDSLNQLLKLLGAVKFDLVARRDPININFFIRTIVSGGDVILKTSIIV